MTGLTVDTEIAADKDLLGKVISDLQSDIVIGTSAITGTLKYVADYSGFNGEGDPLSSGNYIALHITVPDVEDATITVTVTNPVVLDEDGIVILRIADKSTQTITVVASKQGYESVTKVFSLTGLTCQVAQG